MKLVITIDTEEDNWGSYSPTGNTVVNIEKIPLLQELFDDFNVKPTYLVAYTVASDEKAVSVLKKILEEDKCEIGAHCHPWNTPPFVEEISEKNSMLCNLPADLQYEKLKFLHETIAKNFGVEPVSFRSGRWGFSQEVAQNLLRLGYKVDTSVTPFIDWTDCHGADFSNMSGMPFRIWREHLVDQPANGYLLEVPATIGYLQRNFVIANRLHKMLSRNLVRHLRLIGILSRLRLLNRVWLSPEMSDSNKMIKLTDTLLAGGASMVNIFFHSSSLKAGLTPITRTKEDERQFIQCIKEFLIFARESGIESVKLSEAQVPA
jgi:hypothetical protein